jgi:hypothetical protein
LQNYQAPTSKDDQTVNRNLIKEIKKFDIRKIDLKRVELKKNSRENK